MFLDDIKSRIKQNLSLQALSSFKIYKITKELKHKQKDVLYEPTVANYFVIPVRTVTMYIIWYVVYSNVIFVCVSELTNLHL